MEPVPETKPMAGFKPPPQVPSLRLHEAPKFDSRSSAQGAANDSQPYHKPLCIRRATDPTPSSPLGWGPASVAYRPRNTSPFARGHVRSHSAASSPAPPMYRAKSMPGVSGAGFFARPSSPAGSPSRNRALRKPVDEVFPGLAGRGLKIDTGNTVAIPEEEEEEETEEETPTALPERASSPRLIPGTTHPRPQRPSSPLRNLSIHYSTSCGTTPSSPSSVTSSPLYQTSRYDSFSYNFPASASSTPSSLRSRSPSISSLETIPDSPDAEEAALEAERIAQLKAAADAADGDAAAEAHSQALDLMVGRGRKLAPSFGRDKSKRWSVCGAERRGDIDLETIWED